MKNDQTWFEQFRLSEDFAVLQKKPLAYFCIEYALSDLLPTYAGGLGVLAGDYVRELADQKIPAVAVGLYYHSKYGAIENPKMSNIYLSPIDQGLTPVLDQDKKQLRVKVPIHDHYVVVKVWLWQKQSIPVYLLDTNLEENSETDRSICFKLYDSNKEKRLKQEIVLGIGGYRVLEKLHIEPSIYHMNEGHSVLLDLEIIRHEMQKRSMGFRDAITLAGHHVVFTNHTLVAAGNEIYNNDLVSYLLAKYASELEIPVSEITALGEIQGSDSFSMSLFARRLAGKINAVSQIHAREASKTWTDYHITGITNGIHIPTWDNSSVSLSLIDSHIENKEKLLKYIKKNTGLVWRKNELLVGWARRMVPYKRPLALFGDIKRLMELVNNAAKPLKIIIAGIAHQGDTEGVEIMQTIRQIIEKEIPKSACFLGEYSTTIAKMLVGGCDIWMNTPVVGSEACGTSGMKACLNGVLPLSTKDGWVDEVDLSQIGWLVDNEALQESLLDTLEADVLPLYYSQNPENWHSLMKNARQMILTRYSTTRMLQEYFEKIYLPILTSSYSHYFS